MIYRPAEDIVADIAELSRVGQRPEPLTRFEIRMLVGSALAFLLAAVAIAAPRLFEIEAALKAAAGA